MPSLRHLDLSDNLLHGKLPEWLFALGKGGTLSRLALRNNDLDDVRGSRHEMRTVRMCIKPSLTCVGLPPQSCSAYGEQFRVRLDGQGCVKCDGSSAMTVSLLVGAVLLIVAIGGTCTWCAQRHHNNERLQRYLTSSIIICKRKRDGLPA